MHKGITHRYLPQDELKWIVILNLPSRSINLELQLLIIVAVKANPLIFITPRILRYYHPSTDKARFSIFGNTNVDGSSTIFTYPILPENRYNLDFH